MTEPAAPKRKKASKSPTSRALADCEKLGLTACVVEKFNSFTKQRKDAFGFGDVLACSRASGPMLLQVTSGDNHASRQTKIAEECAKDALVWMESGGRIEVWSYRKTNDRQRGKRKVWTLRRTRAFFTTGGRIGFTEVGEKPAAGPGGEG